MHRVACSEEWCGKPTHERDSRTSKQERSKHQQQADKSPRFSQLLFLRSSPSAVLDPLLPAATRFDAIDKAGATLDPTKVQRQQTLLQQRSSAMIAGQDAPLGTSALEFEKFVLHERAVKTGRAMQ